MNISDKQDWVEEDNGYNKKFKQECLRIIKNNGKVFLVWNVRNKADLLNQELHQIYSRYCPNFKGFSGGVERDDQRIKDFFGSEYDYVSFDNPIYLDKEKFYSKKPFEFLLTQGVRRRI